MLYDINDQEKTEEIMLMITSTRVYNKSNLAKVIDFKRKIPLENIMQITSNKRNNQFLLHVLNE